MTHDIPDLLHRLVGGDASATVEILARADSDGSPELLVVAALSSETPGQLLDRAMQSATTSKDRQLVAIAAAHQRRDHETVDALARDHLVDHPDSVLVAWIAAASQSSTTPRSSENDVLLD
jgi:hypothetical protein